MPGYFPWHLIKDLYSFFSPGLRLPAISKNGLIKSMGRGKITVLDWLTAVSYTHLDVYKRQHSCF